ncbi:peptide chain release factor N(5)-glutamine methyltransferase [Erysipelotrichaceae bacterium RD49]|nr:peptide chain release factor N(5)-glutamine methyltransferase [Erysipelotrichaceae bacterium RD49]
MITWHQLLNEGKERLYKAGNSDQAAMLLLNELCRQKNVNLYMNLDEASVPEIATDYLEGIHRLEKGEPLGYVLGYENFYGYDFMVNEDVLIPRPETEELTGQVLMLLDQKFEHVEHPVVFDVATGSGAIGITLSLEDPRLDVYASDISKDALEVAQINNEKLGGRVVFLQGDMLEPFISRKMHCDFLVCNPPYIPSEEKLEHGVVDFEPNVALFGGDDGLRFYRSVFKNAAKVLHPNAIMAFEMGYDQGERLSQLAKDYFPEANVEILKDMAGKDRILVVEMSRDPFEEGLPARAAY